MTTFERLLQRHGDYTLPYLIYLCDDDKNIELRYINDVKDMEYNNKIYKAGSFSYMPNAESLGFNGGGTLTISVKDNLISSVKDNLIINLADNYTKINLEVIGIVNSFNTVTEIKTYKHNYGTVKIKKTEAAFTFEADDRLNMTFPALIWNRFNNRGNS